MSTEPLSQTDERPDLDARRAAAFFDVDGTLLKVNSARLWVEDARRRGELGRRDMLKALVWLLRYKLALVELDAILEDVRSYIQGMREDALRERADRWYVEEVRQHLVPQVIEALRWHQAQGHAVVLLTAATPYLCAPLAEELGVEHVLCTRLEAEDGVLTGALERPICYGAGKVVLAERWAEAHDVSLARSFFYTDSYTDLPMLKRVGTRVAVAPDPRLRRWARQEGVKILNLAH